MRAEFTIEVEVDDAALRDHVAKWGEHRYPLVADPSEFVWSDLEAAIGEELALDPEITGFTVLAPSEGES